MIEEKRYYVTGKGTPLTGAGTEEEHHLGDCMCLILEIATPGYCNPVTMEDMVVLLTTGKGPDGEYIWGEPEGYPTPPYSDDRDQAVKMIGFLLKEEYIYIDGGPIPFIPSNEQTGFFREMFHNGNPLDVSRNRN